jgi:hypothetical protein
MSGKRFWAALCSALMLFMLAMPAFAEDPQTTANDLKGISPKRYRYLFSTAGGAAVGAGIGILLGGSTEALKGIMIGGGGGSALYLHSHPRENLNGWRSWALIGSHATLGGGLGWTLCGCDDGLVAGTLIGGGASAWWHASHDGRKAKTASTSPAP